MTGKIDARLAELGIELPTPPAPAAAYVPFVKAAGLVYISGQVWDDNDNALNDNDKYTSDNDIDGR